MEFRLPDEDDDAFAMPFKFVLETLRAGVGGAGGLPIGGFGGATVGRPKVNSLIGNLKTNSDSLPYQWEDLGPHDGCH